MALGAAVGGEASASTAMHVWLVDIEPSVAAELLDELALLGYTATLASPDAAVREIGLPSARGAAIVHGADTESTLTMCTRLRQSSPGAVILALLDDLVNADPSGWVHADVDDCVSSSARPPLLAARLRFACARREALLLRGATPADIAALHARLRLADRMSSIGTLAAGVAHELNHPLAFVLGNLELAIRETTSLELALPPAQEAGTALASRTWKSADDDAKMADRVASVLGALRSAHKAAGQMREIVRSLRTLSHPDDEARTAVDVRDAMRSALALAAGTLRARARVIERFEDNLFVWASESQLVQVFLNLVVNAAQATPEGKAEAKIQVSIERDRDEHVVIEIRDEGVGIASDERARIFEPFFTTKKRGEGTGLGLPICLGIVTGLGGEIRVESEVGRGSTFRVILPAHRREEALSLPSSTSAPTSVVTERRRRVLVVDDEPMIGLMIDQLFGDEVDVSKEEQAASALDRIRSGARFDVILCDLMMPGMSGPDLHDELLRCAPDQAERMVFITGGAFTPAARQFLGRVSNARIDKPFDFDTLASLLKGTVPAGGARGGGGHGDGRDVDAR